MLVFLLLGKGYTCIWLSDPLDTCTAGLAPSVSQMKMLRLRKGVLSEVTWMGGVRARIWIPLYCDFTFYVDLYSLWTWFLTWGLSTLPYHQLTTLFASHLYCTQSRDYGTKVHWQHLLMMLSVLKREAVFIFEISKYTFYISGPKWRSAVCNFPTLSASWNLTGGSLGYQPCNTHIFCIKTQIIFGG